MCSSYLFFLEIIYDLSLNGGFLSFLYKDKENNYLFDEELALNYSDKEILDYFSDNVKILFQNHKDWFDLFTKHIDEEKVEFPKEMLIHIFKSNPYSGIESICCKELGKDIKEIL